MRGFELILRKSNRSNGGAGAGILAAAALASVYSSNVTGITIVGNFLAAGSTFPDTSFIASSPGNVAGGGDIQTIFDQAASVWGGLLTDGPNLTVNYGWFDLTPYGNPSASTFNDELSPFPNPVLNMAFTNASRNPWFMDPTPAENSEYDAFSDVSADLGGGIISVGREAAATADAARGRQDMYSVILHELAHALGFGGFPGTPDPLLVTSPRQNPGTLIDLLVGDPAHLSANSINGDGDLFDDALMQPSTHLGVRRLPSDVDILAVQQIRACDPGSGDEVDLTCPTAQVPEPDTLILIGIGLASLGARKLHNIGSHKDVESTDRCLGCNRGRPAVERQVCERDNLGTRCVG